MRVKELMTRDVLTVTPETPLKYVAALLAEHGISGVPVCDPEGRLLGVVSEADIVYREQGPRQSGLLARLFQRDDEKAIARTAGEAMTSPPLTVTPGRPIANVAKMMVKNGVNRLPVVQDDKLIGIVTRADLVRAFLRGDEDIAREIQEDVLEHTLWIPSNLVGVEVANGEVTLTGELERRSDAELVPQFVARVPGVLAVTSRLTWRADDRDRHLLPS
jgi:CBS domain-containing protein